MTTRHLIGNWKANLSIEASVNLAEAIASTQCSTKISVCPSPVALTAVSSVLKATTVKVGTQNVWGETGAFTGETTIDQAIEAGASFTLIGHSERRNLFLEDETLLRARLFQCVKSNFLPVYCIGETLEQREAKQTYHVLQTQLSLLESLNFKEIIIAYEPVWAIGTGKVATVAEIDDAHGYIKEVLRTYKLENSPILYGGSVSPKNFAEILSIKNVHGGLVGGASQKEDLFKSLIEIAG